MEKLFTQSESFKREYCTAVVRVPEVKPIEGSDFLGVAMVNGFSVVVRKDQVKEGDVLFYASLECQLHEDFCRVNNLYDDKERNANPEIKGYFNKYARVRIVKLRGVPSMGYLFGYDEMKRFIGEDFEMPKVGEEFDIVNGQTFCKAYIPPIKDRVQCEKSVKRNKRLAKFDRMIPGEFSFHYDTDQLESNIQRLKPEDDVTISVKTHGTSAIIGKIKVRKPLFGGWYEKIIESLPKWLQFSKVGYDYIYSSRTVIKNKSINSSVTGGFYGVDVWATYADLFKKFDILPEGMTVYGEIVGFTPSGSAIQKSYDYGCIQGQSKFMPYRIVAEEDGKKREWNVQEVYEWTINLQKMIPAIADNFLPINIVYQGKMKDLNPQIDVTQHWHENILEYLKNSFGMEKNEPMCKNKVPREGLVLRIDNDVLREAFKLKSMQYRFREAKQVDNDEIDIESEMGYGEH